MVYKNIRNKKRKTINNQNTNAMRRRYVILVLD